MAKKKKRKRCKGCGKAIHRLEILCMECSRFGYGRYI